MGESILEKELEKFQIDPEQMSSNLKFLGKDDRWKIVKSFFEANTSKTNMISNSTEQTFNLTFKTKMDARKFADNPSEGLAALARKILKEDGLDPAEYDLFFNLSVIYDDTPKNKTPNMVIVRVL